MNTDSEFLTEWVEHEFYRTTYSVVNGMPSTIRLKPNYNIDSLPSGPEIVFMNGYVHVRPSDTLENFSLKCGITGQTELSVRKRTIKQWSDVEQIDGNVLFRSCILPPLKGMPKYKRAWISVDNSYVDNIVDAFANLRRFGFSIMEKNQVSLIISKLNGEKIKIEWNDNEPLHVNDVFDLQDWLVNHGYERFT